MIPEHFLLAHFPQAERANKRERKTFKKNNPAKCIDLIPLVAQNNFTHDMALPLAGAQFELVSFASVRTHPLSNTRSRTGEGVEIGERKKKDEGEREKQKLATENGLVRIWVDWRSPIRSSVSGFGRLLARLVAGPCPSARLLAGQLICSSACSSAHWSARLPAGSVVYSPLRRSCLSAC